MRLKQDTFFALKKLCGERHRWRLILAQSSRPEGSPVTLEQRAVMDRQIADAEREIANLVDDALHFID